MVAPSTRRPRTLASLLALAALVATGLGGSALATTPLFATYIVTYDAPPTPAQLDALRALSDDAAAGFSYVPAAAVNVPPTLLPILRQLPGVRRVYANESYRPLLATSTRTIKADRVWADLGVTGTGVSIAVIDAGVDGAHPDLCALAELCHGTSVKVIDNIKVVGRQDHAPGAPVVLLRNQVSTDSTSGHGSHVASIAAGFGTASETPGKYRGVAPGASIVGYGTGEAIEAVNVLAAYDDAIAHRDAYNIRAINNSWGPGAFTAYDPEHPVNRATDAAWDAGISVVFGAGNDGPRTDSLNMFSSHAHAISVAGGRKDGHLSFFSSRGVPGNPHWHPTVTAPGDNIVAAKATTGFTIYAADAAGVAANPEQPQAPDSQWYATSSGTSMAAPHISGVIALLQQAAHDARGVWLTPQQVRNILQNTATRMADYQDYSMGAGYANALAAVQAARAGTHTEPYDSGVAYDIATYSGNVGSGAFISTGTVESTFAVQPGALTVDVMADWGPEEVLPANQDLDIAVFNPSGAQVFDTFLLCTGTNPPNGYSSFCSSASNERYTATNPAPGTWRVVVRGSGNTDQVVRGLWSAAYPAGTVLPPAPTPASVTLTPASTTTATGQSVALTATVYDTAGRPLPNAAVTWTSAGAGRVGHQETYADPLGRVQATAVSDAPGAQTVMASVGSITASASITWLGITLPPLPSCVLFCPPPPPPNTPGKVSGGGWFRTDGVQRHFGVHAEYVAGASQPAGDVWFDDKAGTKVSADAARTFRIEGSTATFTGPASVNGQSGYTYEVRVTDNGEPGSADTFSITVTKPGYSYTSGGTLGGGNTQVRPA